MDTTAPILVNGDASKPPSLETGADAPDGAKQEGDVKSRAETQPAKATTPSDADAAVTTTDVNQNNAGAGSGDGAEKKAGAHSVTEVSIVSPALQ